MASFGEGDAGKDLIWIIGIVLVLGIIWIFTGGPASFKSNESPDKFLEGPEVIPVSKKSVETEPEIKKPTIFSRVNSIISKADNSPNFNDSQYEGQITIRLGQSYRKTGIVNKEYLIIQASSRNKQSINISDWNIDNGYSERYQDISGRVVAGRSTVVSIPYGTLLLAGDSPSVLGPIILNPGDTAYVVTGSIVDSSPYNIDASFKVNKCSGYLEKYNSYDFVPTLTGSCPKYSLELDTSRLTDDCFDIVRRYGTSCKTPEVIKDDELGTLVDGRKMVSSCRNLVVATFNYNTCFERHKLDKDFLGKKWYVFLRHQGGLYSADRATITLYDSIGKIVDTYSY